MREERVEGGTGCRRALVFAQFYTCSTMSARYLYFLVRGSPSFNQELFGPGCRMDTTANSLSHPSHAAHSLHLSVSQNALRGTFVILKLPRAWLHPNVRCGAAIRPNSLSSAFSYLRRR